jgi:hypothetical protein
MAAAVGFGGFQGSFQESVALTCDYHELFRELMRRARDPLRYIFRKHGAAGGVSALAARRHSVCFISRFCPLRLSFFQNPDAGLFLFK